ncbi:copia protein, partial [Trifolium medium]|nr:copia protein [Trifolium medium]
MAYILIYVDDIILITFTHALHKSIMSLVTSEFVMKELGQQSYFLGIDVSRPPSGIFLSQSTYASEIIECADMASYKPSATPIDTKQKLSTSSGTPYEDTSLYRSLAGALQYPAFTRPDISYVIQQVCLHMHAPRIEDIFALKRILRYVQGTLHFGLHLSPSPITKFISYTDADCGGCPDTRRSTSGSFVFLDDSLISWSSKRQPILSLVLVMKPNIEVLLMLSLSRVGFTIFFWSSIFTFFRPLWCIVTMLVPFISPVILCNISVPNIFEMDIHFVREKVARGQARVLQVPSRHQITDIFTKMLPRILFDDFRTSLSVREPPASTAG